MIVPYMGFFIVDGLGQEPWTISLYAGAVAVLAVFANRVFARRVDGGVNPFPLVGIAVTGFLVASCALSIVPVLWAVLSFGVVGYGLSATALSTMFNIGSVIAERSNIKTSTFNAYMRATTSTAWMIGPALAFVAASQWGAVSVFRFALGLGMIWVVLWWLIAPRDAVRLPVAPENVYHKPGYGNIGLWIAATFVFALSFAHFLTFTALPLFFVQEVGLPDYAPGNAFSVKTFVEVFAIFSTPVLIARFGLQFSLIATACMAVGAILFLATVQTYPQMILGAAIEGLYYGLFSTLGISFVQAFAKGRPAQATAAYWNALMVASVLGGPAAGLIAQAFDFRTVILFAAGVAAASVLFLALASRHPDVRRVRSV